MSISLILCLFIYLFIYHLFFLTIFNTCNRFCHYYYLYYINMLILMLKNKQHFREIFLKRLKVLLCLSKTVSEHFQITRNQPSIQNGTYVEFYLNQEAKGPWHANIAKKLSFNEYVIGITVPPFCIPSGWKLTIKNTTLSNGREKTEVLDKAGPIYIIFNPWCKDDDVYFPDGNLLEEYVENDSGAIFIGNYKQIGAKPWFFGQVRIMMFYLTYFNQNFKYTTM
ncbi:hypothetical protein KUTeg_022916 [Tegillarca granosa]|uniref:Uncharacterized protein n=1 Tax=Tegillarca granosa TaxID=220873 RepID=A0ABQ9E533_TEGGR|nr:hypothetical protein KUTeg_022916 [Tegillarca granosa]